MSKKESSISKGSSYDEIGEFWDSHDATDNLDDSEDVEFEVDLGADVNYFPIAKSLTEQLRIIAEKEGISTNTLINIWIQEKLKEQES